MSLLLCRFLRALIEHLCLVFSFPRWYRGVAYPEHYFYIECGLLSGMRNRHYATGHRKVGKTYTVAATIKDVLYDELVDLTPPP